MLTGAMEVLFKTELESLEIAREGKGDAYCEGAVGSPKEIVKLTYSREQE